MGVVVLSCDWSLDIFCVGGGALEKGRNPRRTALGTRGEATAAVAAFHLAAALRPCCSTAGLQVWCSQHNIQLLHHVLHTNHHLRNCTDRRKWLNNFDLQHLQAL